MRTVHGPFPVFAEPQVGRSRGFSITNTFTHGSRPFTFQAELQAKRSRSIHGSEHGQAFTFPTAPLGAGERTPERKNTKSAQIRTFRRPRFHSFRDRSSPHFVPVQGRRWEGRR
jgi:hypothetical protein